ncbi:hypothetical protein Pcinc_039573 [Petrolisthes cinctipes]|uniref:Uncharacterized protein n=1 Tax=Petrolisthes cinctipes TaxID=88211 RepID=A0AAE1BRE3_PETCI|nr:hypothetical protein Pcinc_039573 [Petrolisthes cinctipes]
MNRWNVKNSSDHLPHTQLLYTSVPNSLNIWQESISEFFPGEMKRGSSVSGSNKTSPALALSQLDLLYYVTFVA